MMNELSRGIIDYCVISFFGVNDEVLRIQIEEFKLEYGVEVIEERFEDHAGFRKAVVKFK